MGKHSLVWLNVCVCVCACVHVYMYTTCMYCLDVGFDINALAQGIKSSLALQVWFQAVPGARTYGTDSPTISSQPC